MGTKTWQGGGRAQITEINATNVEVADEFYLTAVKGDDRYELSFTATEATEKNVLLGLQAAAQAAKGNGDAPWDILTFSLDDPTTPTKAEITGDNPGDEIAFETETVDGGGTDDQTLTASTTTTAKTTSDWEYAENWLESAVPVAGDAILIPASTTYDLDGGDRTGTALDEFYVETGSTITIGTQTDPLMITFSGQSTRALQCNGSGSYHLKVDYAAVLTFAPATSDSLSGLLLHLSGLDNDQVVLDLGAYGQAFVGRFSSAEYDEIIINSGNVLIENTTKKDGSTPPPLTLSGGAVDSRIEWGEVIINGGALIQYGNVSKYTGNGGTVTQNKGDITTLHALQGATYVIGNVGFSVTVTTAKIWKGGVILDRFQKATFTNDIALQEGARLTDVTLDLGQSITISRV
jgi:hypothetical protein